MSELPPGPSEPPVIQTLRWLTRPIPFLESCRMFAGANPFAAGFDPDHAHARIAQKRME